MKATYAKRSKYNNVRTEKHGLRFDSLKEQRRYDELLLLEIAGEIRDIEVQTKYDLVVNGCKVGFYKADFRYVEVRTGKSVTEDVKGVRTPVYALKKKLVKALYNVDIVEV